MSDQILKLKDVENFFQELTTEMLGLDPLNPANQNKVRIGWPPGGAPAWKRNDDVVFLLINTQDDPITYQRDTAYQNLDINNANQVVGYTRVHSIKWVLYGPNSYDNAEIIKNGLYNTAFREKYGAMNLFLIMDVVPPVRAPEIFGGQWWERIDFNARFNEGISLNTTVPYFQSAQISTSGK